MKTINRAKWNEEKSKTINTKNNEEWEEFRNYIFILRSRYIVYRLHITTLHRSSSLTLLLSWTLKFTIFDVSLCNKVYDLRVSVLYSEPKSHLYKCSLNTRTQTLWFPLAPFISSSINFFTSSLQKKPMFPMSHHVFSWTISPSLYHVIILSFIHALKSRIIEKKVSNHQFFSMIQCLPVETQLVKSSYFSLFPLPFSHCLLFNSSNLFP